MDKYVDNPFKSPAIVSLCPGGLHGLESGIERSIGSIDIITYVEIEAVIISEMVRQMEKGILAPRPVWSNVKTFLPIAKKLRGKVDGITAGYPCQPFSHVGKRKGGDDPRHLYPYISDIVNAIRPFFCFFENVSGHLTLGYEEVKADLEGLGYRVEQMLFTALEVGSPHIRKRLFILAMDNSMCGRYWGQEGEIRPRWFTSFLSSQTVDNSISEGLQGHARNGNGIRGEKQVGSVTATSFPLGQGIEQWEWEASRVESRLGFTVNGYNYREDLLRMAGNGVIHQVAELAFRTLIQKFL